MLLVAVRTRVDTTIHPVQPYIKKGMVVEVGQSEISPSFDSILKLMFARGEQLAFAPDTNKTRYMLDLLATKFPLVKMVARVYKDESELEGYIRSDLYGINDHTRNLSNPIILGAIVFHAQGPQLFDYSIRLNHTWAFSGFPDVHTIMDVNGPYLNDLELGMTIVPTLQYGLSGFLTLQQMVDSLVILLSQQSRNVVGHGSGEITLPHLLDRVHLHSGYFIPANIRIAPFPTREYTDDNFQSVVKRVMGVLYLLGFLYPVSRLITYTVSEKELKIKEGLFMMGLKDDIFYLSWFITYFIQFGVSSAIIAACTMNSLFLYSDKSLVFIYFFLFGSSAIMLSFFISTFFSRAKAAAAVGTLSFLGASFPYYTVNDSATPMIWKIMASFLSPTAFALGTVNFADYERAHVGVRWTNMWQASSGVNFLVCLVMMMIDTLLYCLLALYFDKVLPREYGACYSWNFVYTWLFRRKKATPRSYPEISEPILTAQLLDKKIYYGNNLCKPAIEGVSLDMKQQELDSRCIQIMNLQKVYETKGGKCTAVNSLELTLFENQILALLGHNGAGKSTTISMLVGLVPPTSGDATIFGKSVRTDMDDIRTVLGVCPQNDILFNELTVKEHMECFATLKGVEKECLHSEVLEMIEKVGLADKINATVGSLSGGMKRKLSLGIALIGDSKVIILDEPTSGMDPYSMRSTWQLIKGIKKGRIILLTTHSMEEADVLGDRIAIMADGHLRCCGSSLFLKHRYGAGYTLTIAKSGNTPSLAADIVHRHVPSAMCLSDVGTEISFRLPLSSSSSFEGMFREIENCILESTLESPSYSEKLPGIESYGISVTTLEEVFLRVSAQSFDCEDIIEDNVSHRVSGGALSEGSLSSIAKQTLDFNFPFKLLSWVGCSLATVCCLVLNLLWSVINSVVVKFCCFGMITSSTFWKHCKALFIKRAVCARRDRRTIMFQLFIPAIFLLIGLLFLKLKPHPDEDSITLTSSYFNPLFRGGGGGPIAFNLSLDIAKQVASNIRGGWIQKQEPRSFKFPNPEKELADAIDAVGPELGPVLLSMSEYLITSLNESYQSRYGAVVMDDLDHLGNVGYTILHNSSCQHSAPTYINLMNAAILRLVTADKNMTIHTRNHPLPLTSSQRAQRHDLDAFSASIIVGIAFSFIPASYAVSIVKEREVKAKHQQLISGVSLLSYWISTYVWDFISFLFPTLFALILFSIFGLNQFIGSGCILPTVVIFLGYGLSVASLTYCMTFFFSDHTVAQNVVLLVHFFSGLILMVISFVMGLIEGTKSINSVLKIFFRLFPGFCFTDGLASLALREQGLKLGAGSSVLDWNVTGASICYLAAESITYFMITILLELFPYEKPILSTFNDWWKHCISATTERYDSTSVSIIDEDEDVKAERQKILGGCIDNAMLYLCNLRKVYPARRNCTAKVAVHPLTFSVQEGECFGFLGTNGAGKTTTLSMLTGEESPCAGTAYIFGNDIRSHPKAVRQHIGYCPQFDPLLEFLTPREHLELYARIKGVSETTMAHVVSEKLAEFDLQKHADKPSYSLSGGNKRKLSVAIAMIGNPPIVILDEPSTGMDPVAKRFMWDAISCLSTRQAKSAIILTTHSMAEAQALCTRIGIMVGGQLRCIGSTQHLKTRFGEYLELQVKPCEVNSTEVDALSMTVQRLLSNRTIHSRSLPIDIEICAEEGGQGSSQKTAEIHLTKEMIITVVHLIGNEELLQTLSDTKLESGASIELFPEQLAGEGAIPLRVFAERWLAKQKFMSIDSFVLTSFPGATFHGYSGLSIKYQLPYGKDWSLADIFGHLDRNRERLGIEEYSLSQSTLESIFYHLASLHANSAR